jgi:NTE family protein
VAGGQQAEKVKELFDHRTMIGVQAAYYYKTIFGPIGATLGYSNHTKEAHFYINLGYEF